jgi:hypothetical protein
MANLVLSYITDAALEASVDLPGKQFVTSGQAPEDVESVSVAVISLTTGLPSANIPTISPADGCSPTWSVVLELTINRCAPKGSGNLQHVTAEKYTDQLRETSIDTGVLMVAIDKIRGNYDIIGNIAASLTLEPYSGGMVPVTARVTVGLP